MIAKLSVSIAIVALVLASQAAAADLTPREAAGRRVAEAHCAECHAIGAGPSPLKDAPPFRDLHARVPVGGRLEDLLARGMIAPQAPPEEGGGPPRHPRMPQANLDEAEVAALTAYIERAQRWEP